MLTLLCGCAIGMACGSAIGQGIVEQRLFPLFSGIFGLIAWVVHLLTM